LGVLQAIADIILILAALISLVAFAFLAYAAWTIVNVVREVKGEVNTVTGSAKDTLSVARRTTHFVGGSIVKPASIAVGYVTGVTATLRALTEDVSKKGKR